MTVKELAQKIVWMGHDTFRIDAQKVIYFDPYQITSGPKADLILITHEHFDHCSPEDVNKIRQTETVIVTEKGSAKKLSGDVRIIRPGVSLTIDDISVQGVPAYNMNKQFHPKASGWLGFIVEIDGVRVYHAGDTDFIPEMRILKADIAMLPVSGTYVMTADEAVQAALAIRPELAIPMHYGTIVGGRKDADRFQKALSGKVDVMIL